MLFRLSNAQRTFHRAMKRIFEDYSFVKIFLDDILIHNKSVEEHREYQKKIFDVVRANNIKINFEKSNFVAEEVSYLGNLINAEGIKADISKLKTIQLKEFKPEKFKDVQKSLEFCIDIVHMSSILAQK